MNTLLNTISAQITYTRGALIALFAGLFILAACGGVAVPVTINVNPTGDCETNGYGDGCGEAGEATRARVINACIDAIKTGGTCDVNIPMAVLDCLNEPFTAGCTNEVLQTTTITIETVQTKRTDDCRGGTNGGATCTGAIVNVCGAVDSTNDGVLFTETLCGTAYDASRTTLINDCRTGVEAGQDRDVACADVVITTDAADNKKALDCVLDPFAEGCDTNDDVKNVVDKTDDTIESIDDVKTDSVAFCRGADDFATNSLCMNAITTTCADDPFTLTTGASPTNFCNPASRTAFLTRCTDADENNNVGCDTVNVSGDVKIKTCVDTPYATGCGDAVFNGLKTARYNNCTSAAPTDDCALVETTVLCVADAAKASERANPFSPLCRASSADYTTAQSEFCTARAGDALDECTTGFLTTCDANPLDQTCIDSGLYAEAGNVLTTLCTTDATLFDNRCNGFTNTVTSTDIATTRDGICETEATSFHAGCLDRTEGVALAMRKALVITCRDDKDATGCDELTANLTHTVAQCAANPYRDECKDDANFADELGTRTSFCGDTAEYFNGLCDVAPDIDTTRETFCTEGATSFDTRCEQDTHGDVMAGQVAFAEDCRDSGDGDCLTTMVTTDVGPTSIAACVNNDVGTPFQGACLRSLVFEAEREARSLHCADHANINDGLCRLAKQFNPCVSNPFGKAAGGVADCDADVYRDVRNNRDSYCAGAGITADDTLCTTARKNFICDGKDARGTPTADICGADNRAGEQELCRTKGETTGECSNVAAAATPTACQGNPFNPSFGAYRLDCTDVAYYPDRIPACSGAIEDLPNGASASDCAVDGVAEVICADNGENANPFAKICAKSEATSGISGFDQDIVQEEFCGDTRLAGDCTVVYTRICMGANLVEDSVGEGEFDCLMDDNLAVTRLRNAYCVDATGTFNPKCVDGTHGLPNAVNNARKNLADTCSNTPLVTGCDKPVNGVDGGRTVAQCSGHATGDPYHADCRATEALRTAFENERAERATFCSVLDRANDSACQNAVLLDACILHPYGQITGSDPDRADCDAGDYALARTNRDTYCIGARVGDNLCTNRVKALCDGVDGEGDVLDDPFAVACDAVSADNTEAQRLWCGNNGLDPKCESDFAGSCLARPFDTIIPYTEDADEVNCLTLGGGVTYRLQRQLFCADGTELDETRCDTTHIAPVVCGTSEGPNSNPFADFCANSANDGLNNDTAARLAVRQGTLDFCEKAENSAKPVCVNAGSDILALGSACADGVTSITAQCAYTQYFNVQEEYCTNIENETSNIFDDDCKETTHGGVLAARQVECSKTGTSSKDAGDAFCPGIVSDICTANSLDSSALTPTGPGGSGGYLCKDESGTAYADARERACGADGTGSDGTLGIACKRTLADICIDEKLIGTSVGKGGYNCRTSPDEAVISARQNYCALNDDEANCAPTLTSLCTGTSLVETASNGYVCSTSEVDDVVVERQRFCADPQGGNTTGCPAVLAELCKGAASLMNGVDTGDGATSYNCKDDITTQAVVNQRQAHCADGENDNAGEDCRVVIAALCTGKLVQIDVPTGVLTGAGMTYNCATSEVQTVKTARETHCRLGTSNTGGLCDGTIMTLCSINPFEERDRDGFGSLCVDAGESKTYTNARKEECRIGTEMDGQADQKCQFIKVGICDGDDVGDSPYAPVCGDNADNQVAFCRLSNHPMPVAKCVGTIATVCHVDTGDPFDTLCDTTYHAARATRCRQSELETGSVDLPIGANCDNTITLACEGNGDTITANPFDDLCDDTYDNDREAACRPTGTPPPGTDCSDTITNYCGDVGDVDTANLFDSLCTIGTTYDGDRRTFCTMGETIFDARCDDTHGDVTIAQKAECLKTGSSTYNRGDVVCPGLVTEACANPFTKQTKNTDIDLCMGDNEGATDTYENIRSTKCKGAISALPEGVDASACKTEELSGAICGDATTIGSNPFAPICSEADGNFNYAVLTDAQRNACRSGEIGRGECTTTIEGFCGTTTTPTTSNNLFDTLCSKGTDYKTARDNACLAADAVVAGLGNDCTTREGVKSACAGDPFIGGCTDVDGQDGPTGYLITFCTVTNIFDDRCLETDESTYGDVDGVRDAYCRGETAIPADGEENGNCVGARKTEICVTTGTDTYNPFANLCRNDTGNALARSDFCTATKPVGEGAHPNGNCADTQELLCPSRPFGTNLGTSKTIDCKGSGAYAITRKDLVDDCLEENPAPENGATCTQAIKDCIANPFSQTAFNGEPCDADAFINAFLPHCEKPENAWEADCNAYESMGRVMAERKTICETEATSFRTGCEGSAYESPERTLAREALALTCVTTPDADGCTNSVNGMGTTVANCSENPFNDTNGCYGNTIFEKQRMARIELCEVAATSFNDLCKKLDVEGTDETRLGGIATARVMYCRASEDAAEGEENGVCKTIYTAFCDGDDAGDKPHAAVCGGTANEVNQKKFCRIPDNSTADGCDVTILAICHVNNGNPFDELCPTDGSNIGDRTIRATACFNNEKTGDKCSAEVIQCNMAPFGKTPTNEDCNPTIYAVAQTAFCTIVDNVFDAGCTNEIYSETTANRETECLKLGMSSLDAGDLICPMFVTDACEEDAFAKQKEGMMNDLCTGDNKLASDTYENIRLTKCGGEASAFPSDVTLCSTPALSGAICGNGIAAGEPGSVVGTDPFAKICSEATGNYHYAMLTAAQQNACRLNGDADGNNCMDTIALACDGNIDSGGEIPANPFDSLCGSSYDEMREALCRPEGTDNQNKGCPATIENFCGTDKNPHDTNDIFDTLCDTGYETARQNHCLNLSLGGDSANCGAEGQDDTVLGEYCKTGANELHCPNRHTALLAVVDTTDWVGGARNSNNTDDLTILDSVGVDDAFDTNYVKAGRTGLNLGVVNNNNAVITDAADGILMLSEAGKTDATGSGVAFARIDYSEFTAGSKVKYYAGILSGTDLGAPITTGANEEVEWPLAVSIVIDDMAVRTMKSTLFINLSTREFLSRPGRPGATLNFNTGTGFDLVERKFFIAGGFTTEGIVFGTTGFGKKKNSPISDGTLTGLIGQKGLVAAFVSDGVDNDGGEYAGGLVAVNPDAVIDCTATGSLFNLAACPDDSDRDLRASLCQNRDTTQLPVGIMVDTHCTTEEVRAVVCLETGNPFDAIICESSAYDALRGELCIDSSYRIPTTQLAPTNCGDSTMGNIAAYCTHTNVFHSVCDGNDGGATYIAQRQTLCAPAAASASPLAICLPIISKLCGDEPFNATAGQGTVKIDCLNAPATQYATARQTRITLCVNGTPEEKASVPCTETSVATFVGDCTTNPFATKCAPYATQYRTLREERIAFCADGSESTDPRCEHAEVMAITNVCTPDPFASDCTPFAVQYRTQRTTRLNDCLTPSGTRGTTECTNADAVICSGYSPFDAICVDTNNNEARRNIALACAPDGTRADDYVFPAACDTIVSTAAVAAVTVKDCVKDPLNKKCNGTAAINISDCRADPAREVAACDARLASGMTVRECIADPMNERCSGAVAIGISACRADPTREALGCNVVISAGVPSVVTTIKVSDCVADPWNAVCPQGIFDDIVKDQVCGTSTTSFTAGCLDPANGFVPPEKRDRLTPSQTARRALVERCATDDINDAGCNTVIAGGKTLDNCIANPFDANCRGDAVAFALANSKDAVEIRTTLVARCADSDNLDRMNCDTMVAGAGSLTIAQCTATPFDADCSGVHAASAFNIYRAPACTTAATSFNAGCTEEEYSVTEEDEVIVKYRDTARAERALGCADPDDLEHNNCTDMVSGSLTVDMCNATPFAPGCESPAFTHARLEACKNDDSPNAACSLATALARTNYVTDLDTNPASLYVGDTYVDDNSVLKEGVQVGGLTLNDVGYADADPGEYTDQSASGFALAYIPEVRDGDRKITSQSRYYAGLLSGTDVGPEFHNATGIAAWTGKLSLINKGVLSDVADFTLDINFDTRTIRASDTRTHTTYKIETYRDDHGAQQERSVADKSYQVKVDYAHTTLGQFFIDGKFTTKGVIYGATKLINDGGFRITEPNAENELTATEVVSVPGSESSRGSLTGVIGQNGAVGAFVSSGSGNTFGEYAGGFVAAPEFDCTTNPLDIRCNHPDNHEAREDACSGTDGWKNAACDPVFARVCTKEGTDNEFSSNARVNGTMGIDCLTAPKIHEDRKLACDEKIGNAGGPVPGICTATVDKVCMNTLFDDFNLCHRSPVYQQEQYIACSASDVRDEIFNPSTESARALDCLDLISTDCGPDPFDSRFCYIGNNYDVARLDKCSDHNFAATEPACTGTDIAGAIPEQVNVIKTYCDGLSGAKDAYNLCGNTADYVKWRDADNDAVTGWNAAEAGDAGLIAGGESKLNLGGTSQDTHNELTLLLKDSTTSGFALASAMVDGKLQSYGGLLSGTDVGAPVATNPTTVQWSAKIALLWQDGANATETTVLANNSFSIGIDFGASETVITGSDIRLVNTAGEQVAEIKFDLRGDDVSTQLLGGRVTLLVNLVEYYGDFRGLIGDAGLLGAFASSIRTGDNAFAGGLLAQKPINNCVPDGTGNPFANNCGVADKRAEVTRCYANGADISGRPTSGDCNSFLNCFTSQDSTPALFKGLSFLWNGNNGYTVACDNPEFDGARAIFCANNPTNATCVKLRNEEAVATTDNSDGDVYYNVCIGRPFGANCGTVLGAEALAAARFVHGTHCMTGGNITTPVSKRCEEFVARVGRTCADNPFGASCASTFIAQVNQGFGDRAQTSRLAHCATIGNEASDLCTGALTHCAVDSPNPECGTLVANYCLGAADRTIDTGSTDACVAELATTCETNPFGGAQRCIDEQKYKDARLAFCEGDGTTLTSITLAICTLVGLDVTICGDGTSVNVGTNPFADVCKSTSSNRNFGALNDAQKFYCGSKGALFLDASEECEPIVATACGTGGFDYSSTAFGAAFDPLCSQDTYDYARLAVCTRNRSAEGCTEFLKTECPAGAVGNLIGCAPNENSTPISVWADNVPGVLAEGSISQLGGTSTIAKFAQAGLKNLDLTAFGPNIPQSKLILSGNSGVAFANKLETTGGGTQLFAGLLRGTNVGGPLLNNTANGEWAGRLIMAIGRGNTSDEVNFTLNVAFTGNGGTLTTQDTATADTLSDDIDLPTIPDTGARNRFTGLNLRINGAFTAEGVIYGTTDLYFPNSNLKTYKALKVRGALFSGRLTGLVGKTGAVGAFVAASSKTGNISVYVGGFVASPDTADNPYEVGANCGIGGTPLDATICPEDGYTDATARAVACLAADRTSFTDGSHEDTVCKSDAVKRVICAGTDKYANPYNADFCSAGYMTSDTITRTTIDAADMEVTTEFTVEITLAEYQLAFVNRCDANIASAPACSSVAFVRDCLANPYSAGCSDSPAFVKVRTNRETFCGREANGAAVSCTTPVNTCAMDNQPNCENIISAYCLGGVNREINGSTTLCESPIDTACKTVNPFSPRCADSVLDETVYDPNVREFCSSKSLVELAELGASLANDCKQHAQGDDGICGYYIEQADRGGPRVHPDGGNRYDQPLVRVIGTNPLAEICINGEANPDIVETFPRGQGDYTKTTLGHSTHADQILKVYNELRCSNGFEQNTRVRTRADNCVAIVIAGATGYNAWKADLDTKNIALIPAGDIVKDTANAPANFIAGHGGDLYLGVVHRDVRNAETFTIAGTNNGFAYASTGTQIFTGLLSGTTLLGDVLAPFMVDENTITTAKWFSTLSFLIIRDGVITQPDPKEGFVLNVDFAPSTNTITGIQNVGTGMVFQVAGEFTGNLLSGTVTLGEADETNINIFKSGGLQSTGILTGVIGVEGAIGVFKSNAGGDFGDFVGGFVAAPETDATVAVWERSFFGRGDNVPTDIAGEVGTQYRVNLHSSGIEIRNTAVIADGGSSFIRLNAENEIVLNGVEFTILNPTTRLHELGTESELNARGYDTIAVESHMTTINSLAFFNNNGLKTPDNGDSGITFGQFRREGSGGGWVRLAGLWPNTNMGLPLTAQPKNVTWQGRLSAVYASAYTGEKDVRFTIDFDGVGGTVKTAERVFIGEGSLATHYIHIDAEFDRFGAISGTTRIERIQHVRGHTDRYVGDAAAGRVSGLIGAKGLIGAFVSTYSVTALSHYVGGFYALNPNAQRAESAGAPTNVGLWNSSISQGGSSLQDEEATSGRPAYPGVVGLVVDNFGVGAPDGLARFALFGVDNYLEEDFGSGNSQALLAGFADSNVANNGVGFGKVNNRYYSGLLAGADVGLSLTANQEIATSAIWSGKVALYGRGTGPSNAIFKVSSEEKDISLKVTFDGTESKIKTTGTLPTFGGTIGLVDSATLVPYTLTIDATFNAAGVIKGTTNFYADGSSTADPVAGVVTGLIGTRGAIGSFISTRVFANDDAQVGTVGSYAGGFVVQNPDYIVLKEIKPVVLGKTAVAFDAWVTASSAKASNFIAGSSTAGAFFIQGGTGGIADLSGGIDTLLGGETLILKVRDNDTDSLLPSTKNKVSYGRSARRFTQAFAGLLSGADVGGALQDAPATAVWEGEIGAIAKLHSTALARRKFYLKIEFGGAGLTSGAVGRIWSTNNKDGAEGSMALGHPQFVGTGDTVGSFKGSSINIGLTGTFNAAGVMTGTVRANNSRTNQASGNSDGVFYGLIGGKGAIGTFKSNENEPYVYAGGFTASNPDFNRVGATDDYKLWRVSFNSRGVNRQVSHPTIADAKRANVLNPQGTNVNQFVTETTHFVEGTATGLNLTGSSKVTGGALTPTLLKFAPTLVKSNGVKGGIALWQGDINVAGAASTNIQGYGGLLISTDVGAGPLAAGRTTYTGKIQAYVGVNISTPTDFTLNINYDNDEVSGVADLLATRFTFDGKFNFLGVISGDVSIGADGEESLQGSFNGLLGTEGAVGVFKNTVGNTGGTFIGGFAVVDPFVNHPEWLEGFAEGGAIGQTLLKSSEHKRDAATEAGTHFIRATATTIRGATTVNVNHLSLTGTDLDGGVAFIQELSNGHQVGYTGLLSTTNVGLPLQNNDLGTTWSGKIQAYVGDTLSAETNLNLTVDFNGRSIVGSSTLTTNPNSGAVNTEFGFNGNFNTTGVMFGDVTTGVGGQGSFNGLIGQGGAVGAFKNNTGSSSFVGGFVVKPTQ